MSSPLPAEHRALFLAQRGQPLTVKVLPTPRAGPGSVVVRILAASVRSNTLGIFKDERHPLPTPFVPGFISLGRVVEVGPDGVGLKPGQLVFIDPHIRARDSSTARCVSGLLQGFNEESHRLSIEWRNSTFAEYAKLPLESCHALNEQRLLGPQDAGGLGYSLEDLTHLFSMLIPFGGLADIDVKAGDTVIIAPATGRYGSAAAHVALALGASVIGIGRNGAILSQLESISPRLATITLTGDVEKDTSALHTVAPAGADALWDMSPAAAHDSTHIRSCLGVLKEGARVSLSGSVSSGISFGYMDILFGALTVKGTWMCTRDQTKMLIRMVESGSLPLGERAGMGKVRVFNLDQGQGALETAVEHKEPGEIVIMP